MIGDKSQPRKGRTWWNAPAGRSALQYASVTSRAVTVTLIALQFSRSRRRPLWRVWPQLPATYSAPSTDRPQSYPVTHTRSTSRGSARARTSIQPSSRSPAPAVARGACKLHVRAARRQGSGRPARRQCGSTGRRGRSTCSRTCPSVTTSGGREAARSSASTLSGLACRAAASGCRP